LEHWFLSSTSHAYLLLNVITDIDMKWKAKSFLSLTTCLTIRCISRNIYNRTSQSKIAWCTMFYGTSFTRVFNTRVQRTQSWAKISHYSPRKIFQNWMNLKFFLDINSLTFSFNISFIQCLSTFFVTLKNEN